MTSGGTDSSRRWLRRQHRDPFVAAARKEGLRSRAAFKLRQIDDRYRLLLPGRRIVDLGAAPGGWSQIAAERTGAKDARGGRVVAIDLEPFDPIPGVVGLVGDVAEAGTPSRIIEALSARADVVLSDMAVPATGHAGTDRLRAARLCELALATAESVLVPGGAFVCKVSRGGTDPGILANVKSRFSIAKHVKPPASRSDSAEIYLIATDFRGLDPSSVMKSPGS